MGPQNWERYGPARPAPLAWLYSIHLWSPSLGRCRDRRAISIQTDANRLLGSAPAENEGASIGMARSPGFIRVLSSVGVRGSLSHSALGPSPLAGLSVCRTVGN